MNVKFGIKQINEPSPKAVKVFVNALIILGGAAAGIITLLPPKYLGNEEKALILGIGGVLAGTLKSIEKLLGTTSPPENVRINE